MNLDFAVLEVECDPDFVVSTWTQIPQILNVPEVPPPCWDERPIDADRCWAATLAMCS